MNKSISSKQMMYAVAAFIAASSLLTKGLYVYTKNETWISVVIAFIVSYAIISIYGRLAINHPGMSLFEINDAVFGSIAGKIFSVLYLFFFLTLTVFNTEDLGAFVATVVLPSTPINVIYIIFLAVCAYAVRKGPQSMTRYAPVITIVFILLLLFNSFLILNKTNPENLLPVFTLPVKNYLLGAHLVSMLPFCEIFVFMMFAPYMQEPAELGRAMKKGFIIGAVIILFIVVRDVSVLGNYALIATMPTFATLRLIDVGDILTRLEIIYATTLVTMLFYKVSILLYGIVSGFARLFKIQNYRIFTFALGVLVTISAGFFFLSSSEHAKWFDTAATYSTFFLLILPVLTLIASVIRKKTEQKKQKDKTQNGEIIC